MWSKENPFASCGLRGTPPWGSQGLGMSSLRTWTNPLITRHFMTHSQRLGIFCPARWDVVTLSNSVIAVTWSDMSNVGSERATFHQVRSEVSKRQSWPKGQGLLKLRQIWSWSAQVWNTDNFFLVLTLGSSLFSCAGLVSERDRGENMLRADILFSFPISRWCVMRMALRATHLCTLRPRMLQIEPSRRWTACC